MGAGFKKKAGAFLAERACNWVTSKKPLDTEIEELSNYQVRLN
jgi:hypothetical protein